MTPGPARPSGADRAEGAPAPARPATPAGAPGQRPLLVVCALGVERLALGRVGWRAGDPAPATVLRTGMGPRAACRAVARALRDEPEPGRTAVAVTGFCGGTLPGMRPGDLVLAEETYATVPGAHGAAAGRTACTGTAPLAHALAALGTVHTGPLAGSAHVVRARERSALREAGAIAVDMESAAVLSTAVCGAPERPLTAVRVVVDAPGSELLRIRTVRGGISAFRVLRTLLPALLAWHRSLPLPRR